MLSYTNTVRPSLPSFISVNPVSLGKYQEERTSAWVFSFRMDHRANYHGLNLTDKNSL